MQNPAACCPEAATEAEGTAVSAVASGEVKSAKTH